MAGSSEPAFLIMDIKMERCSIDDHSSILQRPLFEIIILLCRYKNKNLFGAVAK